MSLEPGSPLSHRVIARLYPPPMLIGASGLVMSVMFALL
jgi:hypothetical protein